VLGVLLSSTDKSKGLRELRVAPSSASRRHIDISHVKPALLCSPQGTGILSFVTVANLQRRFTSGR
jgi:hypothetical protein